MTPDLQGRQDDNLLAAKRVCLEVEDDSRLREAWLPQSCAPVRAAEVAGVAEALPPPASEMRGRALKAYEDKLDAVICAWVAIRALDGARDSLWRRLFRDLGSQLRKPPLTSTCKAPPRSPRGRPP